MEDFTPLIVFIIENFVLITQIVLIVLFILLYVNVSKIKDRFSDKHLYKQYLIYSSMGDKKQALQYLQLYYHSKLVDDKFGEGEEPRIKVLIEQLKSDFTE
ncbi:hypothetical protein ACILD6_00120 [Capnocytophaga canimorsus]|uniref:hypothetical protein n=1 Tax=Capnocytophaga canimorsus TaxID=28188 RepID=UPI0037D377E5